MRKNIFKQSWAQKVVAFGLCAAMTVPSSAAYLGTAVSAAADDELPEAIATYEAGEVEDTDTTGTNKPTVDAVDGLWDGAKAWTLTARVAGTADTTTDTITHSDSSISVANPLIGDTDLVEDTVSINETTGLPEWNTAVTITYWVKTKKDITNPSAVVSFKGEGAKTYHKNSIQKYRIANAYTQGAESDPTTEFYYRLVGTSSDNKPIYDFYYYATNKGITSPGDYLNSDDTAQKKAATPQFLAASPGFTFDCYIYVGGYNADGTTSETPNEKKNCLTGDSISKDNFYESNDIFYGKTFAYTEYLTLDGNKNMEYGYTNGMLQLRTDCTIFFSEDTTKALRYTGDGAVTTSYGIQENNSLIYYGMVQEGNTIGDDAITPEDDAEWHYVAYVIKNDEVYYYIDGEYVSVADNFGHEAKKSFNLGTGIAGEKGTLSSLWKYNSNRNGKTIMEWLTADTTTTLNIGGVNMAVSTTWDGLYADYQTVEGTQIACVKVYDVELSEDEVNDLYESQDGHKQEATEEPTETPAASETPATDTPASETPATDTPATDTPASDAPASAEPSAVPSDVPSDVPSEQPSEEPLVYGDANGDKSVTAEDALQILQHAVKLTTLEGTAFEAADVNEDNDVTAEDALLVLQYVVKIVKELPKAK